MGRTPSERPARLSKKLARIRKELNLSQTELVRRLGLENKLTREDISKYERGLRVPSLLILLRYAKAANVWLDVIVDDEIDLPERMPSLRKHEGIKRIAGARRRKE
jgi:transcriptional regulator with XRE-family HTH domain